MIRYENKQEDRDLIGAILHFRYKIDIEDYNLKYDPKKDRLVLKILPKHLDKMKKFVKERKLKLFKNKFDELVVYI